MTNSPVLAVRDLHKAFVSRASFNPLDHTFVPAVDGVSFTIAKGETVAFVGESGCGKSTLARLVLHLYRPDKGKITLMGTEVQGLSERAFRPHRRHVQMVFQNPLLSFDPMQTIGGSIREAMRLRPSIPDTGAELANLLIEVGLSPKFANLRPRNVSGGELQRAGIARAIAAYPELVVLDEPTSALDMSIQGQVLSLMRELQAKRGLSYLLATHDLRMVRMVANRVVVMYLGQIVEEGPADELFRQPRHPYTLALTNANRLGRHRSSRADDVIRLRGSLRYPPKDYRGCRLVGRCPLAVDRCTEPQELLEVGPQHHSRCWRSATGELVTSRTEAE
jgi:oligopeptide/dipeptide ABC transporter ATP-binding protein